MRAPERLRSAAARLHRLRPVRETEAILRRALREPVTLLTTVVVFALAGLLFVSSAVTARGTDLRAEQVGDLRDLIERRADDIARIQREVARARTQVDLLSSTYNSPDLLAYQRRATQLEGVAGMLPATGAGLRVVLDDAPRRAGGALPEGATPDDLVVHQQDVQAVVNALWRGGAVAMQIMDQRVLSTSAVRCVGNTLLLQGRVYSPPFAITAIGDVSGMQESLENDLDVQTYREFVSLFGLGWSVNRLSEVTLPGWQGGIDLRRARVGTD